MIKLHYTHTAFVLLLLMTAIWAEVAGQHHKRTSVDSLIGVFESSGQLDTLGLMLHDAPFGRHVTEFNAERVRDELHTLTAKYAGKQQNRRNLQHLSNHLYKHYLLEYAENAAFQQIFEDGQYDCLTGTLLFAYVLNGAGFEVEIWETNVHVYLKVVLQGEEEVLIESTDRINGVIVSPAMVSDKLAAYRFDSRAANKGYYKENIYRKIEVSELLGLLYYNRAVKAYHLHAFQQSAALLAKSFKFYESERNHTLLRLLTQANASKLPQYVSTVAN